MKKKLAIFFSLVLVFGTFSSFIAESPDAGDYSYNDESYLESDVVETLNDEYESYLETDVIETLNDKYEGYTETDVVETLNYEYESYLEIDIFETLTMEEVRSKELIEHFGTDDLAYLVETYGVETVNAFFADVATQVTERHNELLALLEIGIMPFQTPCPRGCGGFLWADTTTTSWSSTGEQRACSRGFPGIGEIEEIRSFMTIHRGPCGWTSGIVSSGDERRWRCPILG